MFQPWERYLEPTTLNRLLLAELWGCMSQESKVSLLECLMETNGHTFLPEVLVRLALAEPQAYLRYLAARSGVWKSGPPRPAPSTENATLDESIAAARISLGGFDATVDDRIRTDSSPLVRAALSCRERKCNDYSWMMSAPQVERLIYVATEISVSGDYLTDFVRSSVGHVSDNELQEVLMEYCCSRNTKSYFGMEATGDAMTDFTAKGWFDKVWDLVGTVPRRVSLPVVWYFPTQTMHWEIPEGVIARLDDDQLASVLRRPDASLPKLRKRIAERSAAFGEKAMEAAIGWRTESQPGQSKDQLSLLATRVEQLAMTVDEAVRKKRGLFG